MQFKSNVAPNVDAFKHGFFYRVHLEWNKIPLEVRICDKPKIFKVLLKEHLWKMLLEKPD